MSEAERRAVGAPVRKKDAMALLLGKPVYTEDVTPADCLVVKVLRSPHANALIESIDPAAALRTPGVVAVYTWEDVPQKRFTMAGQTWPDPPMTGSFWISTSALWATRWPSWPPRPRRPPGRP